MMIQFKGITKKCGSVIANNNISFKIQSGSIHALVGENGAGKSTLCKILFGLMTADSGQIFLNGKAVQFASPVEAKAAGLGMVHQHFMLAGPITALDHVILENKKQQSFLADLFSPIDRNKILADLVTVSAKFKMHVPWDKTIDELSVGIHQRIEILKLLYNQSEILILDEPTAGVDIELRRGMWDFLRDLNGKGVTIVLTTHYLEEAEALCDRVAIINK